MNRKARRPEIKGSTLIQSGEIVTMNDKREVLKGDLRMANGEILAIAPTLSPLKGESVINASDCFVIPGLIQTHTHLCQTLFRGMADDLELLDWLTLKIWPLENAHDEASLAASAQIGLLEMQLLGTTSIMDMGTVKLHEIVFAEAERSGMRYWGGNCLMDLKSSSGPLWRNFEDSLAYSEQLILDWHQKTPLLQYAVCPRFAISCSERMLLAAARLRQEHDLLLHTHASENLKEVKVIKKRTGQSNIHYLKAMNLLTEKTVIAHGIHLEKGELRELIKHRSGLAHCPSSNLKLASGIAPISAYIARGLKIGLGSDGAACNNGMDPFLELRLAALLQKPLFGPTSLPARTAFELATVGGARVLNAEDRIGSLAPGKRADIVVIQRNHPSAATVSDPYSALVYSISGRDVRDVWIDGRPIVRAGVHTVFEAASVIASAKTQARRVLNQPRRQA